MDFHLSEEQLALQKLARQIADREFKPRAGTAINRLGKNRQTGPMGYLKGKEAFFQKGESKRR